MKKMVAFLLGVLAFIGFGSCSKNDTINTTTVPELDLNQYMGRWYEIARFDHTFERNLEYCTADYALQDNGMVKVTNSGYVGGLDGKFKQSDGKARRPDANVPGQLEVSFFLSFYSQYNVLELAPDYRYALVGSKTDKYLWILSRTPQMSGNDLEYVLERAKARGYDTDELIWVKQK